MDCAICTEDTGFHIGGRCSPPTTVDSCDQLLVAARLRRQAADHEYRHADHAKLTRRIDWLLEIRLSLTRDAVPA